MVPTKDKKVRSLPIKVRKAVARRTKRIRKETKVVAMLVVVPMPRHLRSRRGSRRDKKRKKTRKGRRKRSM